MIQLFFEALTRAKCCATLSDFDPFKPERLGTQTPCKGLDMVPLFSFDVVTCGGSVIVVAAGEIDLAAREAFRTAVASTDFDGPPLIDCAGVTFIDSSGLTMFAQFGQEHGHVRVVNASDTFRCLVGLAGLEHLILLESDGGLAEAV